MTRITVSHQIEVQENQIPPLILRWVKEELTLPNPEYQQAIRFSQNPYCKTPPQFIELFKSENGVLILPRGYGSKLLKYLRESNVPHNLQDRGIRQCRLHMDFSSATQPTVL